MSHKRVSKIWGQMTDFYCLSRPRNGVHKAASSSRPRPACLPISGCVSPPASKCGHGALTRPPVKAAQWRYGRFGWLRLPRASCEGVDAGCTIESLRRSASARTPPLLECIRVPCQPASAGLCGRVEAGNSKSLADWPVLLVDLRVCSR